MAWFDAQTGKKRIIEHGDSLVDFRGETWIYLSRVEGHKVYAKPPKDREGFPRIFFGSVFGLEWHPEEDEAA